MLRPAKSIILTAGAAGSLGGKQCGRQVRKLGRQVQRAQDRACTHSSPPSAQPPAVCFERMRQAGSSDNQLTQRLQPSGRRKQGLPPARQASPPHHPPVLPCGSGRVSSTRKAYSMQKNWWRSSSRSVTPAHAQGRQRERGCGDDKQAQATQGQRGQGQAAKAESAGTGHREQGRQGQGQPGSSSRLPLHSHFLVPSAFSESNAARHCPVHSTSSRQSATLLQE